jgi:phosphomannomutase/phosphoglucomutase
MKKMASNNVFREYDIRGIVGSEIPINQVQNITKSILTYFLEKNPNLSQIVVGMDGRNHSQQIKNEVFIAATRMGISILDIGTCPTPVFYFSLFNTDVSSGIMITASHNPKEYNGFKICLNKKSVWGKQIQKIKNIYLSNQTNTTINSSTKVTIKNYDAITDYINWMCEHFKHLQGLDLKAVIDCGNGAGGTVVPKLINQMDFKNVKLLFEEVDGNFPNHEADPTKIQNMLFVKNLLENKNYELGLGLDGDCDRMSPMTKKGYLVPGDKLLAIYTKKIIKNYPNANIVFDIKSSEALEEELISMGANPLIAPSGHSIIKEHLCKHNAKLAGELSCHFFFNDRYFGYDDGIYAALRLFELLYESDKSLDEMLEKLPKKVSSPEYRIKCAEQDKVKIVEHVKSSFSKKKNYKMLTIDGLRAKSKNGWGLIRASNTQPAICLRFESDTKKGLDQIRSDFESALLKYFDKKELEKHFYE